MRALLILIIAVFIFNPLSAQLDRFSSPSGFGNTNAPRTKTAVRKVAGTPYMNEEFQKSFIKVKDGTVYEDVMLRYNILDDEIEFLKSSGEVRAMNTRDMTQWAIIGRDTIVTRKAVTQEYGHYVLLASGEVQLLLKKGKRFKEGKEPEGYQEATDPAYVDAADEFYLSFKGDDHALELPKKKEAGEFFGAKGPEVAAYMKKEKLSLKKKDDLLNLVNFYNAQ